ncbi:putative cyclin-dependent serine/threonine-protein kinase [Colletotrichum fructicola]|nr:putative cyclin-dependent serine/threonine-protein kinase [Colletotrichum fructicola]
MLLEVLQTDLCVLNTFGRDISLPLSVGSASSHELERSRETFASENNPAIGEVLGACRGVIGSIDRLHRLGSRIRVSSKNPNDGSLEERVLSFSRTLESDGFETTIRLILDFKFPDARKGLIDKLTKSIVFRRNRLLYERNHQHKLDEDRQHRQAGETGPSGSVIGNVETGDQNAPINENHVVGNTSQPINRASPSDMVSATDHTPFSEEKFKKHVEEEPAYTTRSGGSSWVGRIVYPMPPTVEEDASHVRCQFCFRELSREDLQEPRFWEKHVDGDLQQYVCVSENCRRPLYFFNSEDAWRRHMELDHQFDWPQDCVSDLDLPLVDREDPEFEGENALYRTDSAGESQGQPLICAEDWSDESRRQFCEYQWMLLAPFFHRSTYNNVNHYALRDRHLLPFVEEEDSESAGTSGNDVQDVERRDTVVAGFSQVYMVRIHPEHHDFHGLELDPERGFAIKQLRDWDTDTRERFTKEVDMLKKFTGDGAHPHVVSLLATYEQFGLFHLIFHRADGDLFQYWKFICPNPTFDSRTVLWVAKQLAGLASGLLRFHRHLTTPKIYADEDSYRRSGKRAYLPTEKSETRYGRHGDLKPENMLWFPGKDKDACGGGVLKITDFGQAEFHSKDSKTYRQSKGVDTLTYRPPEGEIFPRTIRQSSDIWSLGCIYLEFVTWMLGGADDLQKFKTSRLSYDSRLRMNSDTFFECVQLEDHEGAQLKPAVSRHIDSLAARRNCSQYFKDVLNLIRDMLVVESNDKDLIRQQMLTFAV